MSACALAATSPLPPPPIQYADFAVWQRSWMDGEALQRYLDFWLQEIAGAPQALELPTDRPRPAFLSMRGGMARLRVAAADVEALRAVGRKEGATTFMALLAIWGALLERLTGAGKVLISSPNANRGRTETQGLLGFLLTQLVFATDVTGDPTFRELLVRARGTALRAFSHQDLPFGKLVEAVRPERDPSRAPLVQVNLLVLDTDTTSFEMPGLTLENVRLEEDVVHPAGEAFIPNVENGELKTLLGSALDTFTRCRRDGPRRIRRRRRRCYAPRLPGWTAA